MSLQNLKNQIKSALRRNGDDHPSLTATANEIGDAVDAYVQEQIGKRLRQLPASLNCATPGSPVVTGPGFTNLIREAGSS